MLAETSLHTHARKSDISVRRRTYTGHVRSPPLARRVAARIATVVLPVLPQAVRPGVKSRTEAGPGHPQWLRDVMTPDTRECFESLKPETLDAVEISGSSWEDLPWRHYEQLHFPDFDLCNPAALHGPYDLVICEQVLEHVADPIRAVRTLKRLCKPDGFVFVSTPFLVRLHDHPVDYWRFTPDGLAILLRSQGLEPVWVRSWGNRDVIVANFDRWVSRLPWQTLRNEKHLPAVVWSLARHRSSTVGTDGQS